MLDRKTNRMHSFDYSNRGGYFLTICTQNRINYFGDVNINQEVVLNDSGKIVEICWNQIPNHFGNCIIDEFIVMPNHIHGIIFIENDNRELNNREMNNKEVNNKEVNRHASSLQEKSVIDIRQKQIVPVIISSFKSAVSKLIHQNGNKGFKWQKSYYDRIIRDNDELASIRQYIIDNPKNWEKDNKGQNENILL